MAPANRTKTGRFSPGTSGNPSGRPKTDIQLKALAKRHAPDAIKALADIAKNGESESARVSAANALLDRGYGKPAQEIDHKNNGGSFAAAVMLMPPSELES